MKTAAKVFIIIGIIFSFYLIYPIILGIFALKEIDNAKTHEELTGWGVVTLIFVSLLGGIFMLCIKDEELLQNQTATTKSENIILGNRTQTSSNIDDKDKNNDLILAEMYDEV